MSLLALILSLANLPAPPSFQLISSLCKCHQYPWAIQNASLFTKAAHDIITYVILPAQLLGTFITAKEFLCMHEVQKKITCSLCIDTM